MKREFLTKLLPDATKEVIDQIMNENGKDIEAQKNTISTLTTERDGLKTQLDTARSEIQSYKDMDIDGIKAKAADWEAKYNADTQKLKDDLAAAEYPLISVCIWKWPQSCSYITCSATAGAAPTGHPRESVSSLR